MIVDKLVDEKDTLGRSHSKYSQCIENYRRKLGIEKIWRHKLALPFSAINTRRRFFGDNTLDLPDSPTSLTKKKSPFGWIRGNYH